MKKVYVSCCFFFTLLCSLYGYTSEMNYSSIANDLSKVSYFSVGMNGFIGKYSKGENDVRDILKSKNATEIFLTIANNPEATSESKLYVACGLKQLGKINNKDVKSIFEKELGNNVSTLKADILRREKFKDIYFGILKHGCL
ncbi:MchS3 family protein [Serratia proteamaculans]|uniref:MchS3 family protein n=1 Tax=Serratia proteamaculans TaxID=28151 RepID=UPI0024B8D007|nr:MchS3 family protein [Serratia proteamaculans]